MLSAPDLTLPLRCVLALIALLGAIATQAQDVDPPTPDRVPDTLLIHGDTLYDSYNWMRDKNKVELINYLYAENAYATNVMQQSELLQKKLYNEFRGRMDEEYEGIPSKDGPYWYYSRYERDKDWPILCRRRDSITAPEEIYFDVNTIREQFQYFNLMGVSVSPDHSMVAYLVDTKGGEAGSLFVHDIARDTVLPDRLDQVTNMLWAEDNKTLLYSWQDPKNKLTSYLLRHELGTEKTSDVLVFEESRPKYSAGFSKSTSEDYIFISSSTFLEGETWFFPADQPDAPLQHIAPVTKGVTYGVDHYHGDEFYALVNGPDCPDGKLVKFPIGPAPMDTWQDVVPHKAGNTQAGGVLFRDFLVTNEVENGRPVIRIHNRETHEKYLLPVADSLSTISLSNSGEYDEQYIWYRVNGYTQPGETRYYDLTTGTDSLLRATTVKGYDPTQYQSHRLMAPARDGTLVPVDVIYRNDTKVTPETPLYLYAYASYGSTMWPGFDRNLVSYLDRGFIYAVAHCRGESIYGKQWHDDGKLLKKKNTVTDFIDCAEYLHENGYSAPNRTAIEGRSAGGMLMGAVTAMRPDLFEAVIAGVPYVDVINGQLDTTMVGTKAHWDEVGNPYLKEHYDSLLQWDPYFNTQQANYPNVLVLSGYNDPRVYYWLPTKWAAKLRHQNTSDKLILLKTDMQGGHFGGFGRYAGLKDKAFEMAFMMRCLGIEENYIKVAGKVQDKNGDPLPYATVFLRGTQDGTTTNFNGQFALDIRKDQPQEIVVQFVGFRQHTEKLSIDSRTDELVITMQPEDQMLKAHDVNAKSKDPAYSIMRKAIARRKHHLQQVQTYEASIYLKGTTRLDEIPEKRPFFIDKDDMPDSTDLGLVYLSESASRVYAERPGKMKEQMYASKVAGYSSGYSWNRTQDVLFNFYENNVAIPYYSDKPFVSPLASTAMVYYRYEYAGTLYGDGAPVDKIKVIPRIKGDPLFHGYVYLNQETYSIHSLDLLLTKDAQIKFVDTLVFQQEYIPVNDSIWMPRTLKISSRINLFGFGAQEYNVGVFNDYRVNHTFPEKFFTRETFSIEAEANKKDSVYWSNSRPIMLTDEEAKNYHKEDSAFLARQSPAYRDSVRKEHNKFQPGSLILQGWSHRAKSDSAWWSTSSIVEGISFNTVEGWAGSAALRRWQRLRSGKSVGTSVEGRYGAASKEWGAKASINYRFDPRWRGDFNISGGRYVEQFNSDKPIGGFLNTLYTLVGEQNYMKLYLHEFVKAGVRKEVSNGLYLGLQSQWSNRHYQRNNSGQKWFDHDRQRYTLNHPRGDDFEPAEDYQLATADVEVEWRPGQTYESTPDYRFTEPGKWPIFKVQYRKGMYATSGDNAFDFVSASADKRWTLGQLGATRLFVEAGSFLSTNNLHFIDYHHFAGNETHFITNPDGFQTLPYYDFSTDESYLEIHARHQFNGFILAKIPGIRALRTQSHIGFNALATGDVSYNELYFGLENIFNLFRVDLAGVYEAGEAFRPSIRVGLDVDL